MHLLSAKPGGFVDEEGIIDLDQSPADLVILSAQDTSLALLADTAEVLPADYPSVRLANLSNLIKPAAYDLYEHRVLQHAKLIVVALLGGKAYWSYGIERLAALARANGIALLLVPGDDQPDAELTGLSYWPPASSGERVLDQEGVRHEDPCYSVCDRAWRYLRHGGVRNATNLYRFLDVTFLSAAAVPPVSLSPTSTSPVALSPAIDSSTALSSPTHPTDEVEEPRPYPPCVIHAAGEGSISLEGWLARRDTGKPTVLVLFYRSHLLSGNTQAFDALEHLLASRFNVLTLAVGSLKDAACLDVVNHTLERADCQVIINTTSFSQHLQGNAALSSAPQLEQDSGFTRPVPVIQAILAANDRQDWQDNPQGLRARDVAMNVVLPEFDGRIISRAISFKELVARAERTQIDVVRYRLHEERAGFVVELAYRWSMLALKPNATKRLAVVLSNYPTRDGRIGNGVGLDTPASVIRILRALRADGHDLGSTLPADGDALIRELLQGVTNDLDRIALRPANQSLSLDDYERHFAELHPMARRAVTERWGSPAKDPKQRHGRLIVSGLRLGHVFVGIQPARGFDVDVVANYHDPDLVPPHGYLAFHFWLRHHWLSDAVVHVGKHGNLEWLPGKSIGLSNRCWPDIALGPLPNLYPFIVNDPGEGAQAKRRAQAVIIDHLMPPLARADSYGPMLELERLVDEYYQAMGLDARRENRLREQILTLLEDSHLRDELAVEPAADEATLLGGVDTYLCDLKEAQIRHGLHCLGEMPPAAKLGETLSALVRLPRGASAQDRGLLHCLAADLGLDDYDPSATDAASPWQGTRPALLANVSDDPWRHEGDTRERLELLGLQLLTALVESTASVPDRVGNRVKGPVEDRADDLKAGDLLDDVTLDDVTVELPTTQALLNHVRQQLIPALQASGRNEIDHLVGALNGHFVPAGPSGAPSRGRLDVLPTGRNFYSLDTRTIPTRTAWELGRQSAELIVSRYLQEHGDYPSEVGISVWGTATMRTGGDDIAQALALMGVRPVWSGDSNRVVDVEVVPGFQLTRPRVDVTLRISGFFRDAFANVARLFDSAVQALSDYEDPGGLNTIRTHMLREHEVLVEQGLSDEQARSQSRLRIFGSKPGAYGAGLQGLIDAGIWKDKADLAQAYVNWGGYSYGAEAFGQPAFTALEHRLSGIELVVQNQDNREHDLLDSDDYYQFQGGMANAIDVLSGSKPAIYHGDHADPSRPKIRTLKEELNRVIRSRVLNPKWIGAMREHGYKGAFEMAASVDYLFAYDATTGLIDDYQYAAVADALVLDPDNRAFVERSNPDALKEMSEKLIEAQQRGLWQEPGDYREALSDVLLDVEDAMEASGAL